MVITFRPRSKCLLISWLQSPSAVILEPQKLVLFLFRYSKRWIQTELLFISKRVWSVCLSYLYFPQEVEIISPVLSSFINLEFLFLSGFRECGNFILFSLERPPHCPTVWLLTIDIASIQHVGGIPSLYNPLQRLLVLDSCQCPFWPVWVVIGISLQILPCWNIFIWFLKKQCEQNWPLEVVHLTDCPVSNSFFKISPRTFVENRCFFLTAPWKWSSSVVSSYSIWDPMVCSLLGSSVHGTLQAGILEWVANSFSRGSSWPKDQTRVFRIAGRRFTVWATEL